MSSNYLSRFYIRNFRSIKNLDISLEPKPGVLIVVGANGVGKSSLFDALEWNLTGRVGHFGDLSDVKKREYLRRWSSDDSEDTLVELKFSESFKISRGLAGGLAPLDHNFTDIAEFLKSPVWRRSINAVDKYLSLTHFLGQSTTSRMTHVDGSKRWDLLAGPAQNDFPETITNKLHGHQNSAMARAFTTQAGVVEKEALNLQQLLDTESTQFESTRVEGAVDESHVLEACNAILKDLATIYTLLRKELPKNEISYASTTERLDALEAILDDANETIRQYKSALTTALDDVIEHQRVAGVIVTIEENIRAAKDLELSTFIALNNANQEHAASVVEDHSARIEQNKAQMELTSLMNLREAIGEVIGLCSIQESVEKNILQAKGDVNKANLQVERNNRIVAIAKRLEARSINIENKIKDREADQKRLLFLNLKRRSFQDAKIKLAALNNQYGDLVGKLDRAYKRIDVARNEETVTSEVLKRARTAINELTVAVATIASQVDKDSCVCPVCATNFPSGQLQELAFTAAERLSPTIVPLEKNAAEARLEREDAEIELNKLKIAQTEINKAEAEVKLQYDEIFAECRREPKILFDENYDFSPLLKQSEIECVALEGALGRVQKRLAHPQIGMGKIASSNSTNAIHSRDLFISTLSSLQNQKVQLDAKLGAALQQRADLAFRMGMKEPKLTSELDPLISSHNRLIEKINERLQIAQNKAQEAASKLSNQTLLKSEIERKIEAYSKINDDNRLILAKLEGRWRELGINSDAPISFAALEESRNLCLLASNRVDVAIEYFTKHKRGYALWRKQIAYEIANRQLRSALKVESATDREALLKIGHAEQNRLRKRLENIRRAKKIAQEAHFEVSKRVEDFNQKYLNPINETMEMLNRAILTTPDIGLNLNYSRKKVEQKARGTADAPDFVSGLDPILVHSEGQMASLAVSMLCAASLTFQWSRWPALIMDDPLQHNDVVHAAAFADMMRNLIDTRGYQIFISTHDMAQAEFLRRKFLAGKISCAVLKLLGQGEYYFEPSIDHSRSQSVTKM